MKYFSLSYALTEKDYSDYEKIVFKGSTILAMKRMILPFILIVAACLFMDSLFIISALVYFALSIIIPQMVSREFSHKTRKNSKLLRRMMNVDFYGDHLVINYVPNEAVKSYSEKHYGFDVVLNVLESTENIYFAFKDNSLLIIPKAVLDNEKYTMISNLIENLFKNKYQKLGN